MITPSRRPFRVAIVGAGPAGSALASLLARQGGDVTLFDDGRRPELLVGESLVPAVVPILQRLGIEGETAALGLEKPGVSFIWSPTDRFSFTFARFAPAVPAYAYNVPRPRFDEAILASAVSGGAQRVVARARFERPELNGAGAALTLAEDTLSAAPSLRGEQPDLIVDATGRARRGARVLGAPARIGPRRDVAHFAHFSGFSWDETPGQVLIARMNAGWSWRIPLQDRLSVGIVLGREDADRLGRSPEERLERAIAADPWLSSTVGMGKRVSAVATYSNYQLISERGYGPGWVMVGDAFGFIDPMLSPGVFLALRSAELLAEVLAPFLPLGSPPSPAALASALGVYAARYSAMLDAWSELVGYFYSGRMLALLRAGRGFIGPSPSVFREVAQRHIERHIALQASGIGTTSRYSRGLLRVLSRHGLRGVAPAAFAIR